MLRAREQLAPTPVDRALYEAEQAKSQCVRMLESGPAAGVIGTQALCHTLKLDRAIAFDMGGTTAKAGVIHDGEALTTGSALIGGYEKALPVQMAMMDIFEVGTGGGSIARVEDGALLVGPQSAGAQPGPACYGLGGTEPTVTDANLVLGRIGDGVSNVLGKRPNLEQSQTLGQPRANQLLFPFVQVNPTMLVHQIADLPKFVLAQDEIIDDRLKHGFGTLRNGIIRQALRAISNKPGTSTIKLIFPSPMMAPPEIPGAVSTWTLKLLATILTEWEA